MKPEILAEKIVGLYKESLCDESLNRKLDNVLFKELQPMDDETGEVVCDLIAEEGFLELKPDQRQFLIRKVVTISALRHLEG